VAAIVELARISICMIHPLLTLALGTVRFPELLRGFRQTHQSAQKL